MANPNVTTAMSGMSTREQVEENCRTANEAGPLTEDERRAVVEMIEKNKELATLYCTGCSYCMPCPQGVGIPQCFEAMIHHKVWGLTELARRKYGAIEQGKVKWQDQVVKAADACVECGVCEEKCPQNIPIIEQLKETHAALASQES